MMCLGWYNKPTCKTRAQIQITPGSGAEMGTSAGVGATDCNVSWFWLGVAALAGIALTK